MKSVKLNWDQTGMPATLVGRLRPRNAFVEFKTVLNDAGNYVRQPVDAESLARELVDSGGRKVVEMVRELTTALANAEKELESANRRYERLIADLERHGIRMPEDNEMPQKEAQPVQKPEASEGSAAEWEEWDRRFRSLLG